jgi:hypothetical protein
MPLQLVSSSDIYYRKALTLKIYVLPFLALPLLAACGGKETETASQSLAPDTPAASGVDRFVDYVRNNLPIYADVSSETITRTAETTCESLDEGMSPRELAEVVADQSMTMSDSQASEFGEFVGASVRFTCPEHIDTVQTAAEILISWGL